MIYYLIYAELLIRTPCEYSAEYIFNEKRNGGGIPHRVVINNGVDFIIISLSSRYYLDKYRLYLDNNNINIILFLFYIIQCTIEY